MYTLWISEQFQKKFKKLKKSDHHANDRIKNALTLLKNDPNYPSLHLHKVESRLYGKVWSSWVSGDYRIIWNYNENELTLLDILDIGKHSGSKKVYK